MSYLDLGGKHCEFKSFKKQDQGVYDIFGGRKKCFRNSLRWYVEGDGIDSVGVLLPIGLAECHLLIKSISDIKYKSNLSNRG